MKKTILLLAFWAAFLQPNHQLALAKDSDFLADAPMKRTFLNSQHKEPTVREEYSMAWTKHVQYTTGAFGGALAGSFFVNVFDTLAARRFSEMKSAPLNSTIKSIFRSYVPVAVGVVPMRALSFGVYSVCQELFEEHLGFGLNKTVSAALSGLALTILTTPAEVIKTRRQIESVTRGFTFRDLRGSFLPLASRIIPTVTCMLAGTEAIQTFLPIDNIFFSTAISSLTASALSQIVGTPAENIRTYRVKEMDYKTPTRDLIRRIGTPRLYAGFWHRAFALGTQASFTLVAARLAS